MAFKFTDIGDLSYVKKITLDVSGGVSNRIIEAKQGDVKSRYLQITLIQNDRPFIIPESTTVRIGGTKPDGHCFLNDGDISDNLVYVELTDQMLAAEGREKCFVSLYNGASRLSSVTFFIDVTIEPYDEGKIESSDEYTSLTDALERVDAVGEVAETALTNSKQALENLVVLDEAELKRENAENARVQAEQGRVTAENERAATEEERNAAEQGRTSAENARNTNEQVRQTQEAQRQAQEQQRQAANRVEIGTVTLTNTLSFPFNDSVNTVALTEERLNTDYTIYTEIVSANGIVGDVEISDKLVNGFKIAFNGSATSVTIKYYITGGYTI